MAADRRTGFSGVVLGGLLFIWFACCAAAEASAIPEAIVALNPNTEDTRYVIVVEKSLQRLKVFASGNGGVEPVNQWKCSTGEVLGAKLQSGDKKTPEGVYFLVDKYEDRELSPIYGVMAYPLDYPNFLDKNAGKNGSAIWLHGTNKELKDNDTNGCIALENKNLKALSKYISLNRTPVVIVEKMQLWSSDEAEQAGKRVRAFLDGWNKALAEGDYHRYLDFYDTDYFPDMSWWNTWRDLCRSLHEGVPTFALVPEAVSAFLHDGVYVVLFDQVISAGNSKALVGKKKLFIADAAGDLSIIGETYHPFTDNQPAGGVDNPLVASSRRFKNSIMAEQEIKDLLDKWVRAWEAMNMDAYGECYSRGFVFKGMNRQKWLAYKRNLNRQYDYIRVELTDLRFVEQSRRRSVVTFIQHYTSDQYSDTGLKTLVLRQEDGQWVIYRESWKKLERLPEESTLEQAGR
ncbi:MAG: L,D-transpeptidase family protein [Thermodesulfobacteriota bacterium]|nr:L,D-transpeptidase family protein [Thermodesulfobacteriota bacterium]